MRVMTLVAILALVFFAASTLASEKPRAIPPGEDFGAGLTLERPTALASVLAAPERFEQRPILLHGSLADVCQRKGCWTVLREGDAHVRVRFLDYGFFLPTDATGAEAFIEGTVKIETLSEKDARHYEAEARNGDPESIKGPQREVGFTASGVRLIGLD